MKKIVWLFVLLCLITGCGNKNDDVKGAENEEIKDNNVEEIEDDFDKEEISYNLNVVSNLKFEINSDLYLYSLIEDDSLDLIVGENEKIDTSKLGVKNVTIKYRDGKEEKEEVIKIKVVDTEKPVIKGSNNVTINAKDNVDLLKGISVSDNSKEEIKVNVEGSYDISKEGSYSLKYVAIDSSGNREEVAFTLVVKAKSSSEDLSPSKEPVKDEPVKEEVKDPVKEETKEPVKEETKEPVKEENSGIKEYLTSATYKYKVNYNVSYVKETNDFEAKSRQDILNIFYTAVNLGADKFYFYCKYDGCFDDVNDMSSNELFYVQDYVSPYNAFKQFSYSMGGNKVTINGIKRYTEADIAKVDNKINTIVNSNIKSGMSTTEKVKALHDYLVNNNSYDDKGLAYDHSAVGALINGTSVCEGYAHAMALLLNKINVPNYRISVIGKHTWNLVYVDGKWLHLDATWDDPIALDSEGVRHEVLYHSYFLVDGNAIGSGDTDGMHKFNKNVYKEA